MKRIKEMFKAKWYADKEYVTDMLFWILNPILHQDGLTFVVGDAVVKALRSIWSCCSVEGLHRERAGWWRLCPVLKQCLFYKSKLNVLKWCYKWSHFGVHKFSLLSVAYRHRGEDTDFHHGLWTMTRPLLHHSHRTPLHCSYPAAPRSPLSWPPDTQTTLFIHTHTHTEHLSHSHGTFAPCQSLTIRKTGKLFSISSPVHSCYYYTDKTMTETLLQ